MTTLTKSFLRNRHNRRAFDRLMSDVVLGVASVVALVLLLIWTIAVTSLLPVPGAAS